MSLLIELCSTFYITYVSEKNAIGMIFFAFIAPFLGLPFVSYIVDTKVMSERVKIAFASALGYVAGSLIVINFVHA